MPIKWDEEPQEQHAPAAAESPEPTPCERSETPSEAEQSPKRKPGDLKAQADALLADIRAGRQALDRSYIPGVDLDGDDPGAHSDAGDWQDMWRSR